MDINSSRNMKGLGRIQASMESTRGKRLMLIALLFGIMIVRVRVRADQIIKNSSMEARDHNVASLKKANGGGGGGVYGGGGCGWGWGGPGGSSGGGGGGGGAGYWKCSCRKHEGKRGKHHITKSDEDYDKVEFAQCTTGGRCKGMRLDCPLHCGGPCLYDCRHTCKAYCKR